MKTAPQLTCGALYISMPMCGWRIFCLHKRRRDEADFAPTLYLASKTKPPRSGGTKPEPSAAGPVWKGGARERADDVFFAIGIKRRRSKADFAPTWNIATV